jgi:hypothetical protein
MASLEPFKSGKNALVHTSSGTLPSAGFCSGANQIDGMIE